MAELIRNRAPMTLMEGGGDDRVRNATQTFHGCWLGQAHIGTSNPTDPYLLPLGKPLALLAYLDCAFRRSASRERLISLIWSEDAESRGRQNLRQTLFYIRQRLGADLIESEGDQLRLITSLNTDRDVFEGCIARESWSEAVAAYRGAFLDGFAAPGSAGMEQWASVERMRLSQLFLGASDALAKELLSTGKAREAIAIARRARDEMRGEQRAWRILLEAQLSARDQLSALAEADALEQQLADDGDELEQATKALVRTVRSRAGLNGAPNGRASESELSSNAAIARDLIAREHEFSAVINAWDDLCADKPGQWIHISAPSGLGKSRLLSDIAARLRAVRAAVVEIRASPGERDVSGAFAANIAGVLAGRRGARAISVESAGIIVGLAPSASAYLQSHTNDTAMGSDAVRRRALALTELLQCVAHENRVALMLDDLHWADAESRLIVDALFARAKEMKLLLVTTARPLRERDFAAIPDATMSLHGFSATDVHQLLSDVATLPSMAWSGVLVERLVLASGGSPLLIIESVQRALDAGVLRATDRGWECSDGNALEKLLEQGSAIRYRVKQLDADAIFLLTASSLAGVPLSPSVLDRIVERRLQTVREIADVVVAPGNPSSDSRRVLAVLEQRGMMRCREKSCDVAHDEIAESAIAIADASLLQRAHEALAFALLSGGDRSSEALVRGMRHLVGAGSGIPSWVLRRLVLNARERGDARSLENMLTDALRGVAERVQITRIVKGAPLRLRSERMVKWGIVAAVFLGAVALGAAAHSALQLNRSSSIGERSTMMLIKMTDDSTLYRANLSSSSWQLGNPIELEPVANDLFPFRASQLRMLSNSGVNDLGQRLARSSNGLDIFILDPNGTQREIVADSADDVEPMWATDARSVIFASRRWDRTNAHLEVAYRDAVTDSVWRLTNSSAPKSLAAISPDGFQFAYTEDLLDAKRTRLCWQPVPKMRARSGCIEPDSGRLKPQTLVSWTESGSVLVEVFRLRSNGVQEQALVKMDLLTGAVSVLVPDAAQYYVSPDGQWIVSKHMIEHGKSSMLVRPTLNPNDTRNLNYHNQLASVESVGWNATVAPRQPVSIRIERTIKTYLNEPISLAVAARSRQQSVIDGSPAVFESLDTAIVSIDSTQRLHPNRIGRATIIARLGTAIDTSEVVVEPPSGNVHRNWRANWSEPLTNNWYLHGLPVPKIGIGASDHSVLEINGDNNNSSAITSRVALNGKEGAGVEVEIETPMNDTKWQNIAVALFGDMSDDDAKRWGAGIDEQPRDWVRDFRKGCSASYPAAEGNTGVDRLWYVAGSVPQIVAVPTWMSSGRSFVLRIQVMSDGRCEFTLNGKLLPENSGRIEQARTFRVNVQGASVGTKVRVLRLEAWEGVRH